MTIAMFGRLFRPFRRPLFPQDQRTILIIVMPAWGVDSPPHHISLVASVARGAGFSPRVRDLNIAFYHTLSDTDRAYWQRPINYLWMQEELPNRFWTQYQSWFEQEILSAVRESHPCMVALTVSMSTRITSQKAGRLIKHHFPDIPVMFGGVDCFPGEQNVRLLCPDPEMASCDIICQGECEVAFARYLDGFGRTGDWKTNVPGFAYYVSGHLKDTGPAEVPSLKESMPVPAYDLFDLSLYTEKGALPFYLSRGCMFRCAFCSEKYNYEPYRFRRAEEAFEEIRAILPYSRQQSDTLRMTLADSLINGNIKEWRRFMELMIASNIKAEWGGMARISPQMTEELLILAQKAGLAWLFWGIESGSQRVINLMNKKFTQEEMYRLMDTCIRLGIQQHIPIIIGFPGEEPQDIVETSAFILKYKDQPKCSFMVPFLLVMNPKSPIYQRYAEFGLANNRFYDWHTPDFSNSLPVRIARRFVVAQAQGNAELSLAGLVDTEEMPRIDLNDAPVATDLYGVLREIFVKTGEMEGLGEAICRDFEDLNRSCGAIERAEHCDEAFQRWLNKDKNSEHGRRALFELILAGLRDLRQQVSLAKTESVS